MIGEPKPDMGGPKMPENGVEKQGELKAKIDKAIEVAIEYGGIDGGHHKMWVIDQMLRVLAGDKYDELIKDAKAGKDGPDTYDWDEGIAP